ncbi:MAG: hypothetical protein KBD29_03325 [Candidatus Magasanikbacteria bacterium]|nr:hypothetical protein [Candidatus Magasanikbacteria bacterium]
MTKEPTNRITKISEKLCELLGLKVSYSNLNSIRPVLYKALTHGGKEDRRIPKKWMPYILEATDHPSWEALLEEFPKVRIVSRHAKKEEKLRFNLEMEVNLKFATQSKILKESQIPALLKCLKAFKRFKGIPDIELKIKPNPSAEQEEKAANDLVEIEITNFPTKEVITVADLAEFLNAVEKFAIASEMEIRVSSISLKEKKE